MFSFQKGEPVGSSSHKIHLRAAAHHEWPSLTRADLASITTESQLSDLVSERTGRTREEATVDVRRWMQRQNMRPDIGTGFQARRPVSRWENEGGALEGFVDKSTN
jgi:hypothetical protein